MHGASRHSLYTLNEQHRKGISMLWRRVSSTSSLVFSVSALCARTAVRIRSRWARMIIPTKYFFAPVPLVTTGNALCWQSASFCQPPQAQHTFSHHRARCDINTENTMTHRRNGTGGRLFVQRDDVACHNFVHGVQLETLFKARRVRQERNALHL